MRKLTIGFYKMREISWPAEDLLASQEEICSMELISQFVGGKFYYNMSALSGLG
jgi:hypothetical protein